MILEYIFLATLFLGGSMAFLVSIGAIIYDVKEVKRKREITAHPNSRKLKNRPLITIVIFTRNNELSIENCLRSLLKSSYRKFEVIVIDNASRDGTRKIVKNIVNENPKRTIRMIARRSDKKSQGILSAVQQYGKGELIFLLDASATVERRSLALAAQHFNVQPEINVLTLKQDVLFDYSIVGLLQKYEMLLRYSAKKFASITKTEYMISATNTVYRLDAFMDLFRRGNRKSTLSVESLNVPLNSGAKPFRSYYANDSQIRSFPLPNFLSLVAKSFKIQRGHMHALFFQQAQSLKNGWEHSKLYILLRLFMTISTGLLSIFIPVLLTYFLYMTIELREPTLLILSLAALGTLLLIAIWGDDHLKIIKKVAFSLLIPMTYGAFYLMSIVQIFAELSSIAVRSNKNVSS